MCSRSSAIPSGYWFGAKTGPKIFKRPDSRFFKQEYLQRAKAFYEKHGGKTIIIARFIPIVRTFVPVVAGAAKMEYRTFLFYNVIGGIGWIVSMLMLGYMLDPLLRQASSARSSRSPSTSTRSSSLSCSCPSHQ